MESVARIYQEASQRNQRDQLILDHLEYVRQICGTLAGRLPEGVDLQNLQSAGVVGLIEAARSFDESRGVAFKTFSYPRIRGAIVDEIRRNSPLSQKVMQTIGHVRTVMDQIDGPLTPESIAEAAGMTVMEVEDCLAAVRVAFPQRWDEAIGVTSKEIRPEANIELEERRRILADAIEQLPERERLVVTLYYLEELRLKEIGKVLSISESRVSRILSRAELKLREACRRKES